MCETYARIGFAEPKTIFYDHDDCGGGSTVGVADGNYHMFKDTSIGKDDLNSFILAPHQTLVLGSYTSNNGPDLRADRQLQVANDVQYIKKMQGIAPIGQDNADWYKLTKRKSWDQWKVDACTGKETDRTGFFTPSTSSCDQVMSTYCSQSANKSKDVCGCFGSEIPNPSCHDIRCSASFNAYKTKAMYDTIAAGCPTYMDCRQYLNIADSAKNNVLNNVYMQQTCTAPDVGGINNNTDASGGVPKPLPVPPVYTPGPSYNPSPGSSEPPIPTYTPQKESFFSPMVIGLIILIFVIIIALVVAVAVSGDDEPKRMRPVYGPPPPPPMYRPMPQQFQ